MHIIGAVASTIDCVNLGLGKPGTPEASTPLFPPSILNRMTPHADSRMRLQGFLGLDTEKGAAFERAWEWCQQGGGKQLHSDAAQTAHWHDPSRRKAEVAGLKFRGQSSAVRRTAEFQSRPCYRGAAVS